LELFVDILVVSLKNAMNIGRLESVFLAKFVTSGKGSEASTL
ncbi:22219_t:CDS:2, partial [Cetraspora pellucida]